MNRIKYLIVTGIFAVSFGLFGCDDDDQTAINPIDGVNKRFSNTWVIASEAGQVLFDGQDRTDGYTDFELIITPDFNFTTVEVAHPDPWPDSGTWSFTNEDNITKPYQGSFNITRSDGLVMNATMSDHNRKLTLTFQFDPETHEGERMTAVNGEWKFVLVAKSEL